MIVAIDTEFKGENFRERRLKRERTRSTSSSAYTVSTFLLFHESKCLQAIRPYSILSRTMFL